MFLGSTLERHLARYKVEQDDPKCPNVSLFQVSASAKELFRSYVASCSKGLSYLQFPPAFEFATHAKVCKFKVSDQFTLKICVVIRLIFNIYENVFWFYVTVDNS